MTLLRLKRLKRLKSLTSLKGLKTSETSETYETFEPVAGEFVYGLRLEQFYALLGLAIRRKAGF